MKKDIELAKKVGARIRLLRKQRQLTQEKLSDLSGIDVKHIQLMESKNPSNPRVDTIQNICLAFGIEMRDFFAEDFWGSTLPNSDKNNYKDFSTRQDINISLLKAKSPKHSMDSTDSSSPVYSVKNTILENNNWLVYYHSSPRSRGQLRIESKRPDSNFSNLLPDEKHSLWDILEKSIDYLNREFKPDGFNIGFDIGNNFGEEDKFILHIIPRYLGDPESRIAGITSLLPEKPRNRIQ